MCNNLWLSCHKITYMHTRVRTHTDIHTHRLGTVSTMATITHYISDSQNAKEKMQMTKKIFPYHWNKRTKQKLISNLCVNASHVQTHPWWLQKVHLLLKMCVGYCYASRLFCQHEKLSLMSPKMQPLGHAPARILDLMTWKGNIPANRHTRMMRKLETRTAIH